MFVPKQKFSTAARIHPNIVPHLRPSRRSSSWIKPVGAAIVAGYGAKTYIDLNDRRVAHMQAMEREEEARKERNERMADMYGDRSSLGELEKAIQFYEKK